MFCPHCGKEFASQSNFCSSCGARAEHRRVTDEPRLVRPLHPRMLAGVCSGIAIHYGWDIALVRIIFAVVTCLTTGCAIFFYIAAWIIIPEGLFATPRATRRVAAAPPNMNQSSAA